MRRFIEVYQHAKASRRLGEFGYRSRLIKPEIITGGKNIFLGSRVHIWPYARIECITRPPYHGTIRIGDGVKIHMFFHCAAAESVTIGHQTLIAGRVYITDHDHVWPLCGQDKELTTVPVVIGDRCWLGEGCAILKGVELGHDCVVGTNAVVTRSAPPFSMLAGMPARVIKRYDMDRRQWIRVDSAASDRLDVAASPDHRGFSPTL